MEDFQKSYPDFHYRPDHNRSEHFDGSRYIHAFFDTIIDNDKWLGEGNSQNTDRYLSEDYLFCQLSRKMGYKIWFCPWMQLGHVGSYVFNGTMGALANLDYAAHGMDSTTRPQLVTKEEEEAVEQEAGRKLSRAERRKMARDKKKKRS